MAREAEKRLYLQFFGEESSLCLVKREVWRLQAHQIAAKTTVGKSHLQPGQKVHILGRNCVVFGQTIYHDVEVRKQTERAGSMEVVEGTVLQLRDATCDELVRATNVYFVEGN